MSLDSREHGTFAIGDNCHLQWSSRRANALRQAVAIDAREILDTVDFDCQQTRVEHIIQKEGFGEDNRGKDAAWVTPD